ncbi:hypothetical protein LTS10_013013 [Elasticomyces elasticus]|nr:hypothetical protein LTS10_013013 [Elasticomyces elasticus]
MESRDGSLSKLKRAGGDLERTAKRRETVSSARTGNDTTDSSTHLLLALTIDHIIVDEPTHLMHRQHITTLLDNCTTLDHLQQLVTRVETRAGELQMDDQSQRAVDAISQVWCKRAAGALSDLVLNENMLAEITTATMKMKMDTGFNVKLFLEALENKMSMDKTADRRAMRAEPASTKDNRQLATGSHRHNMASSSGSAAQGHDTRRTTEIEIVDAVDVQPSRFRSRGMVKSTGAVASQASHEHGMAFGSGSVAQGHIPRRTSEIEMIDAAEEQPISSRTRGIGKPTSAVALQASPEHNMTSGARSATQGHNTRTAELEMSLGTVAQGVDLYWCRRILLKVSREEVKGLMQQLFHSGRDVYIVNHIALAELEAHDALLSLDLQQLRESAARAWAGEISKETDRYGVRHEMLLEGKAYVLSPTDCNNKRQRRRDEYGLIRGMLSPAYCSLAGHDRTAQEQIEQYTTLEKGHPPSPEPPIKNEFIPTSREPGWRLKQLARSTEGDSRENKRYGVLMTVEDKRKAPRMRDVCSVAFSAFGFKSVERFGPAPQQEWLIKLGSAGDVKRALETPRPFLVGQVGLLRSWKTELQPSRDPARDELPRAPLSLDVMSLADSTRGDLAHAPPTSGAPGVLNPRYRLPSESRAAESQTQLTQQPAESAQASSVNTPVEALTSQAAHANHQPRTQLFVNEKPLTVSPADLVYAMAQSTKLPFNLRMTQDRTTIIATLASPQEPIKFGVPFRNLINQQMVEFRPAYNVPCTIYGSASSASWISPGAGITGGYDGNSQTLRMFIVFFAGLAMYNACEVTIMVLLTFNTWRGLYFWSLITASLGIIPYALGFLLKFMNITVGQERWLAVVLLTIGWYPMITGQALVLWSRLHLIINGERGDMILRYTKWMIVIDVIIFHIPTTVLTFGSNGSVQTEIFATGYSVMEKIQMVGFFLQEVTLSSIYIVETIKLLRTSLQPRTRTVMKQLVFINAVIILMDLALLGLEGASLYILETLLKGVIYSIKLKLEFAILGKLVKFVGATRSDLDSEPRNTSVGFVVAEAKAKVVEDEMNISEFVDLSRVGTDLTHPSQPSDSTSRRRRSRINSSELDYNLARFEHVEDISELIEESSISSSRPPSCHFRAANGEV